MTKIPNHPRDPNQLAKLITDMTTGEIEALAPSKTAVRAQKAEAKGGGAGQAPYAGAAIGDSFNCGASTL